MRKPTVCYIDDNESHLKLFEHAFSKQYEISTFTTAEDALELIAERQPKLIVLDVDLPTVDGYQFCRQIRQHDVLAKVPVIFLTCMQDATDRLKGYEAGGDSYVTKPYDLQELRLILRANLMRQEMYEKANKESQKATEMVWETMRNNGELGALIHFARNVSHVRDEPALVQQLFETFESFGLEATVLIRVKSGEMVARSDNKPFSLMEKELLELAQNADRVTSYGSKYLFSGRNIVFLVKNMPVTNETLTGRIVDHLAILIESAEACVEIINAEKTKTDLLHNRTNETTKLVNEEFSVITNTTEQLFSQLSATFENLCLQLEQSFMFLDLSQDQEDKIMSFIERARAEADQQQSLKEQLKIAMEHISASINKIEE